MSFIVTIPGLIILAATYFLVFGSFHSEHSGEEGCSGVITLSFLGFLLGIGIFFFEKDVAWRYIGGTIIANFIALIITTIISVELDGNTYWFEMEKHCHNIYAIIYLFFILAGFFYMSNQVDEIINIETPTVVTNRYELIENDQYDVESENITTTLIYAPKSDTYKFFYQVDENGVTVVKTYSVYADDVKVVVQNGIESAHCDYLLEVVTTYYEENRKTHERNVLSENIERTLYLREESFRNMIIVNGSE